VPDKTWKASPKLFSAQPATKNTRPVTTKTRHAIAYGTWEALSALYRYEA